MEWRVGCSGWSYRHWRGDFYPQGMPTTRWFEHYAAHFDTVELNTTFYRLPPETGVRRWAAQAPPQFCFAAKVSRLITHFRRLRETDEALHTYFERLRPLAARQGPFLYQLPPKFPRDVAVLRDFLRLLPPGRHAFEFRDPDWWHEEVYVALREHGASFVLFDFAGVKTPLVATAPDVYVRFHGPTRYSSSYPTAELQRWRDGIAELGPERVWAYFNNDIGGHAPRNALTFRDLAAG